MRATSWQPRRPLERSHDPRRDPAPVAAGFHAAQYVRLLAATIDMVVDGWEPLANEPALHEAVRAAAQALEGLARGAAPEVTLEALQQLGAIVEGLGDEPS